MDSDKLSAESAKDIDQIKMQKMLFIYNAIEDGWTVKKHNETYIFTKNHENKKEVFLESYLKKFIKQNLSINNL
tara:strand:+ start:46 stop:267 length:222 start_codon:yes stop_codon:yes gene_type:complete